MRLLTRYKALSREERKLFLVALFLVVNIRLALWLLPFSVTRKCAARVGRPSNGVRELDRSKIRKLEWAVQAAARRVPEATCLTQGLAVQILLGRLGQLSDLRLGVARKADGTFEAHAWVEINGRVVCGGGVDGFHRYVRLAEQIN
jgi:hypothetical protein